MNVIPAKIKRLIKDVLVNQMEIIKEKQNVNQNKKIIKYEFIMKVISRETPILIEKIPKFLEFMVYEFQELAKEGEFIFPKNHSIGRCVAWYFKDMTKRLKDYLN